jgi:hypothetical protein
MEKLFDFTKGADVKIRFLDPMPFQEHKIRELFVVEGNSAIPCSSGADTSCPHCNSIGKPIARNYMRVMEQIQIRTHRKKRINKKWAKRYGFKSGGMKMVSMKDWRGKL